MQEKRDAEQLVMQKVDPNATSSETLSDVEANESIAESDTASDSESSVMPSPDGQFDGGRAESVKDDPGPM